MTQIIAGHFQQQQQIQQAIDQLQNAGFSQDKICAFYLNPAGIKSIDHVRCILPYRLI